MQKGNTQTKKTRKAAARRTLHPLALIAGLAVAAVFYALPFFLEMNTVPLHGAAPAADASIKTPTENDTSVVGIVLDSLQKRSDELKRTVTVDVDPINRSDIAPFSWTIDLAAHPELLTLDYSESFASYALNRKALQTLIAQNAFDGERALVSPIVTSTHNDGYADRISAPIARDGFAYDSGALATSIANAFSYGNDHVTVRASYEQASVRVQEPDGLHTLALLASGISDDSGSTDDRAWNVHMAIDRHVNDALVKPGDTYSMVAMLGGPVTLAKGWKMGLGLFGGGAAPTPGAGICQAATTVFRAALLAGLPILERRNHSEWVPEYAVYGAGLDATVFPGFHDLRFKNNTTDDLVFQSYIDGTTVVVNVYGVHDGRSVTLLGPYFNTTKDQRPSALRPIAWDEIGWVYTVTMKDGSKAVLPLIANYYKGMPRKVKNEYPDPVGIAILHDGAPADLQPGK